MKGTKVNINVMIIKVDALMSRKKPITYDFFFQEKKIKVARKEVWSPGVLGDVSKDTLHI